MLERYDVQVVIVITQLNRRVDSVGVRLEIIKPNSDRFLRRRVRVEP
jgi:hypothetical protein